MTVNQVNTKDVLGVMSDEDGCKILYMFIIDGWLVTVVAQCVVSEQEMVSLLEYPSQRQGTHTTRGSSASFGIPEPCQGPEGRETAQGQSPCRGSR